MTQELSSLMDGELEGHEARNAIRSCCSNEDSKRRWAEYHMIGEVMRGETPCGRASTDRIMAALRDEPTVLAPRRPSGSVAGRIAFAAAASAATVAVVAWIGLQEQPAPVMAKATPAAVPAEPAQPIFMSEYVVAHRQIPSAEFYRPVSATVGGR